MKAVWLLIGHFLCWGISIGYSGVVFFLVGSLWQQEHRQHPWAASEERLLTPQAVQAFLDHFSWTGPQPARVTTGVYLQGLSFKSPSEVGLTGIIWQHYLNGEHDHIQSRGFILPEEVEVGNLVAPQEIFRRQKGDSLRIGWRFDATVRQWFHYETFPLDHKTVRLRLWPADFAEHIVLVPDLAAYTSTAPRDLMGIDAQNIAVGGWRLRETYYSYQTTKYNTTWGVYDQPTTAGFPDLTFNVVLERLFVSAAITYLSPLAVVFFLLFGLVLLSTSDPDRRGRFGYSTSTVLTNATALLFVVLLAHVQLRRDLPASGLVYLEKLYIWAYVLLLLVVMNAFLFSKLSRSLETDGTKPRWYVRMFHWLYINDSFLVKLVYWPVLARVVLWITQQSF